VRRSATRSPTISSRQKTQVSLACELQRDWARQDTVSAIIEIVLTDRLLKEQ